MRDFYQKVFGWRPEPVEMGGYTDYTMLMPDNGHPAAGVCHARGVNATIPPAWLIYITVADLDQCLKDCLELGGEVIVGPIGAPGRGRRVIIRAPAGAEWALWENAA